MTIMTNSTCAKCGSAQSHSDFFCQQCQFPLAQAGMTITFVKPTRTPSTQADQQTAAHAQEKPNNELIEAQPSLAASAAFDNADTAVVLSNVSGADEPSEPASPNAISSQLPHFKINEVLGFGGMGTVYRAQDLSLGRYVALKLFHCPRLAQSEGHQRLLAEARLACQLNHPNIVTIYDIARGEQTDFFVMEWVDGLPLNKLLPEHGFELLTALDYALQLLDGLACAHKSEIIHRDIKPQNIMVNRSERIKILDFGIASLLQEAKEHAAEPVSGTWLYMAPEQLNGEPADARADLFAFGVTFYEMLTGQKPFDGNNPQALLSAITASEVKAVSEVKPTLPKALDDILAKLLKADKNERYQNAEQVSQDLAAVQHALTAQKNWWQRRNLATKAALVLPIIALLGYSLQQVLLPPTTQELVARQLVEAKKIAILPFDNISGDPTLQVFADAVVSSLGSDLTRIGYEQGDGSSWVIPVSEVRSLKAQTSKAVYDNYAADLVLTGSIQHMGSTRRVVLNLQSAADGRILNTTELSIAADKLFDGQAEVREEVVNLLGWSVSDTLKSSFAAHRPQLDGAYKAYLEGIGYLYRFDQPQNLNKASAAFQSAIELDNGYTDAYVGLAKTQLRLFAESRDGQWLSAMEHTIALLEQIDPKLPELNSLFGSLYNEKGLYQQAVDALTQSLQKNSFDIEAYRRLAWAYSNLNQFEKAKAVFEQALTIAPHDVSVKLNLGLLYKEHAQYHKAIELFQALIQAVPNHKFAYQNMANSYLILGEIDKAISYTLKAIDINPTATSYSALGTMFFSKQDYQAAVQAFEKAITINSQSYIIWGNLADSYRFANSEKTEGAYRQAIILAEKSLSINPRSGLTLSVLSYYLACVGERERALTYAKKITSSHAGAYHFYVAITYATLENTSEALAHLAVAIEKNYPLDEILTTSLLADLRTKSEFNQFLSNLKPK